MKLLKTSSHSSNYSENFTSVFYTDLSSLPLNIVIWSQVANTPRGLETAWVSDSMNFPSFLLYSREQSLLFSQSSFCIFSPITTLPFLDLSESILSVVQTVIQSVSDFPKLFLLTLPTNYPYPENFFFPLIINSIVILHFASLSLGENCSIEKNLGS